MKICGSKHESEVQTIKIFHKKKNKGATGEDPAQKLEFKIALNFGSAPANPPPAKE